MTTRIVYINPGDMIELRIIKDPDLPRTKAEWEHQFKPESILLRYIKHRHLAYADPMLRVDKDFV